LKRAAKKCTECDELHSGSSTNAPVAERGTPSVAPDKPKSTTKHMSGKGGTNTLLGLVLGLLLGFVAALFIGPALGLTESSGGNASTDQVNGLQIYVRSQPVGSYDLLGVEYADNLIQRMGGNKGKKFLEQLARIGQGLGDHANFEKIVNELAAVAQQSYPTANAVIFSGDLRECRVVSVE
jgi:hypothetical protein